MDLLCWALPFWSHPCRQTLECRRRDRNNRWQNFHRCVANLLKRNIRIALSQQIVRISLSAAAVVVSVLWETKPSKNIEASPLGPHSNPIPEEFVSDSPRDADPSFSLTRRPEKARVENCGDLAILDAPSRPPISTNFLPPIPRLCKFLVFIKLWENDRRPTAPFQLLRHRRIVRSCIKLRRKRNWPEIWVCHSHANKSSLGNLTRNTSKGPYYSLLPLGMSDGASSRLIEFQKSIVVGARYSYCGSNSTTLVSSNFGLPFNLDKK